MSREEAETLAGPNGLIGARVEGIGVVGDDLVIAFGFKGTDDGDVQVTFPLVGATLDGQMIQTWHYLWDEG